MTIADKVYLDEISEALTGEEKEYYETMYKAKEKSEITLFFATIFLYITGISIFYLKGKNIRLVEVIGIGITWGFFILYRINFFIPFLGFFALIMYLISYFSMTIISSKLVKEKIEDYNYDTKLAILKSMNKIEENNERI